MHVYGMYATLKEAGLVKKEMRGTIKTCLHLQPSQTKKRLLHARLRRLLPPSRPKRSKRALLESWHSWDIICLACMMNKIRISWLKSAAQQQQQPLGTHDSLQQQQQAPREISLLRAASFSLSPSLFASNKNSMFMATDYGSSYVIHTHSDVTLSTMQPTPAKDENLFLLLLHSRRRHLTFISPNHESGGCVHHRGWCLYYFVRAARALNSCILGGPWPVARDGYMTSTSEGQS